LVLSIAALGLRAQQPAVCGTALSGAPIIILAASELIVSSAAFTSEPSKPPRPLRQRIRAGNREFTALVRNDFDLMTVYGIEGRTRGANGEEKIIGGQ